MYFEISLRGRLDAWRLTTMIRVSDKQHPTQGNTEMTTKTWTVTAVLNGEMVEYNNLIITEAKNAMAELEKDGAEWIESYREW